MTTTIRRIAKATLPENLREFIKCKVDRSYRDARWRERGRKLSQLVFRETDGQVAQGPFKGMSYRATFADGGILSVKLIGTYEKELHGIVEQIIATPYDVILNIGAGEGYYAVGLARRMPATRTIAFELMEKYQEMLRELARINDVSDRISVHGACTAGLLEEHMSHNKKGRALVICDIEGAEWDVLDPVTVPQLKNSDMLVELHDVFRPGVSREIQRRFAKTHDIQTIQTRQRTHEDFPAGVNVGRDQQLACMDEDRGHTMTFFWMKPRIR